LQRQAGQILSSLSHSDEPVIITQRGRTAAVIVSAERYIQIEEDLQRLDELELLEMVKKANEARTARDTVPHAEVKKRLGLTEQTPKKRRPARRAR
jgi:prevent-host-death family protein